MSDVPKEKQDRDMPALLAAMITLGYFSVLAYMLSHPAIESQALFIMLGSLNSVWAGSMAYYFGTTKGSGRKTELLSQAPPVKAQK